MDLANYRPNVGVVLLHADGRVWLGRRAGMTGPHNWQFPQGGVDAGEDLEAAARRELREETGATSVTLLGRTHEWRAYDFPPHHQRSKAARGWLGQKQMWFAFRFLGEESEFDLAGHDEIEFDAWRWARLDETLATVVPFKRSAYRHVIAAFRHLAAPAGFPGKGEGD